MVLDDQTPVGPGPLPPRPELVRAAYARSGAGGGRATPDAVAAVVEEQGEGSSGSPVPSGSPTSSSRALPPPKPQRRPRPLGSGSEGPSSSSSAAAAAPAPASPATPAYADGPRLLGTSPSRHATPLSPSKRPAGLQLLGNELALEAAEEEAGLLSPFTSIMGLAVALDEEDGGSSSSGSGSGGSTPPGEEEEGPLPPLPAVSVPSASASETGPPQGKEEEDSTLSLLDGVAQSLLASEQDEQQALSPTTAAAAAGHSPRLSLGDDGFVTSPPSTANQEGSDAPPPSPATPTLAATTTAVGGRPPAGKPKRQNHLRRISLPSLSVAGAPSSSSGSSTPRSGGVGGGLSLEALRAKLSGRSAAAPATAEQGEGANKASSDASLLLIQSAHRLGLDVSGLRKALLLRVLGVEPIPTAAGSSSSSNNGSTGKASKRHRSASLGMMPAAWLKRGRGSSPTVSPATPASSSDPQSEEEGASYVVVLWVLDVESGHEWRVRKTPRDLLALHAVVSALGGAGAEWAPREEDFPLLEGGKRKGDKGGGSAAPLSREKQDRLERYLRALAAAVGAVATGTPGAFEAAKTLQDFVGATERVDVLADCEARGDEAAHAARLVQLQGLELLRAKGTGYMQRLERFVREASTCDVHKTELLRAYVGLLGDMAREMMDAHGPRLKAPLQGGLLLGTGAAAGEELDRFCVSALWRLLEAETFLPLRLRLYERVMLETDLAQEKALAAKCALFKSRPQSFFGIPVAHISLSSWETAVAHLRRLSGDVTTLPSDKLDVLVAAVREAHALFRREHPVDGTDVHTLGADDLLPIFIYILCQCGIARLLSLKTMLAALGDPARMLAEAGYCLATLEGAIEYILSLDEDAGEI